ncbi:hypothetical protein B0H13DRAFT_2353259 [Mycena leptocephala]|nr:hypothetical protein B0H13DRAFT_2353259 [Mycena leptocephala]
MSFIGPSYSPQPVVETDRLVQSGNVVALVDKLSRPWISGDHMTIDQEKTFQDVFLMTFRTFITVEELLQMLIARYCTPCPQNLPSQVSEDGEKIQVRMQRRILTVLSTLCHRNYMAMNVEVHFTDAMGDDYVLPGSNLFEENELPFHIQWQDLKDTFHKAGPILYTDVALNHNGRSRGFGTVIFAKEEDTCRAVDMLSG